MEGLWLARDPWGFLVLCSSKPHYDEEKSDWVCDGIPIFNLGFDEYVGNNNYSNVLAMDTELFPEITFENSPVKIKLDI